MTQEREALKLALKALRKARRKVLTTEECHAVIMSIKEALAQPEPPPECPMDSYGDGNVYRGQRSKDSVVKTITLAQPEQILPSAYSNTHQPEQEPVVGTKTWFEDGKVVTQYLYPSDIYTTPPQPEQEPCDMKDMCIGCSPRNADGSCPDAQRKPLTDEQKMALCKQFPDHLTFNAIHAIEAAHGIKE